MSGLPRKKITILGATGHIAKCLIYAFYRSGEYQLNLFARSLDRLEEFLEGMQFTSDILPKRLSDFSHGDYDVIINCVGIGNPGMLKNAGISIFKITEMYDNLVLDYLETHPDSLYINLSSGAVYGTDFASPVNELTCLKLDVNHLTPTNYYGLAKLNTEAKHRSLPSFNIVDLRIFSFFSRFIDLETKYFMSEIISCIKHGKDFVTDAADIVRDYVHPLDLMALVKQCMKQCSINGVFDVYSLKPTTKFEIVDYLANVYGLKYTVSEDLCISTATGFKNNYYSNNRIAGKIGYTPQYSSMDSIVEEIKFFFLKG